jgi:acyl-CoA reductase-like NAD-dependent aldehyde dehydrogenase
MDVINPATGERLGHVDETTPDAVATAYRAARAAQPAWAARPLTTRLAVVSRFRDLVAERAERLAATLTAETGKPIAQARTELAGTLPRLDFFLTHAEAALADEVVLAGDTAGTEEAITHEPLGVVANISAWNYPWFVGTNVFVPALLTGNAVLYKPSEHATLTGSAIGALLDEAGVPDDVFSVLPGGGAVGAALIGQPVDGVFFTGSHATGRRIAETVAGRMVRVQLELGGKDPVYVCDDVDVATAAASLADGAFYNAGQSCCSVERLYVHEAIHEPFVEQFVKVVESFAVGDPTDDATYLGPLTRREQIAVLDAQVADAVARGATVRTGGHAVRGGRWYAPTVLTDVTTDMAVMRDESFGPIIGIQAVRDDTEAVQLMNDTDYGLTAGVYTPDRARAAALLRAVDAGSAYWNCCDRVSPRLPWSGRRHSGMGLTLSVAGIRTFTQPKAWHLRRP